MNASTIKALWTVLLAMLSFTVHAQLYITTVAGTGTTGYSGDDGAATSAQLYSPRGVAIDDSGNIYITDEANNTVRKVSASGIMSTIAGLSGTATYNGDSIMATDATLAVPFGICVDNKNNIYIADAASNRIRKILLSGIIVTVAGTGSAGFNGDNIAATAAKISYPVGVAIDRYGNLYIAERDGYRIRKVDTAGLITTIAGTGIPGFSGDGGAATTAMVSPYGVCIDTGGNVYFSDASTRVRKIGIDGRINTVAGNGTFGSIGDGGPATAAQFSECLGVKTDKRGNIFVADWGNFKVRMINASGTISTVAGAYSGFLVGDGVPATSGALGSPEGLEIDSSGNLYIAEAGNAKVRKTYLHTVGMTEVNTSFSSIFPNPSDGMFTIILPCMEPSVNVAIYNGLGQAVQIESHQQVRRLDINLSVPNGTYYLKISTGHESVIQPVVICH